jgi:hypothetical protein
MKNKRERGKPLPWQKDPSYLDAPKVQFWREGVMTSAMMPLQVAKEQVSLGIAFVISSQAIGALNEKGEYNS